MSAAGPWWPPMPGVNEVPYLTNSSMMDVDFLPRHLIIIGGSYIGLDGYRRVQAATSAAIFIQGRSEWTKRST